MSSIVGTRRFHHDDVGLEALDLARPLVEPEVGHRHHLPRRRHRRAQIILICQGSNKSPEFIVYDRIDHQTG
jgi:hypothetical protein